MSNGPTPETVGFLSRGTIDFGVVSSPVDARPEISVTEVKKIRNVFVAGEQFGYLKGKPLEYGILKELPCIFLEKNTSTRRFMDDYLEQLGIVVEPEFELATSDMIVQFAMRNLGIGCVMSEFAEKEIESGRLFELNFKAGMPERSFCIITDRKNPISPAGGRLLELMLENRE